MRRFPFGSRRHCNATGSETLWVWRTVPPRNALIVETGLLDKSFGQ